MAFNNRKTEHTLSVDGPPVGARTQVPQYSPARILTIWAAAALPMGALAWVVAPWLAGVVGGPGALARALILCLTVGLAWQFVLVALLVRQEQGTLRWPVVRDALWLHVPLSPRTGRRGGRLWWLLVPLVLAFAAKELLPGFATPVERDLGAFLESDFGQDFLGGNWLWFALLATMYLFNTVLGEELLFRGLLLPRMQGAFGSGDWVANGVLFGLYHLHVPWGIPGALLDTFLLAYPSRRYRSALIGIAVHSAQSVFFLVVILAVVLR